MLAVMVSDDDQSCLNQDVGPNVGRGVMSKFLLSSVKTSYIHFESSVIWILWGSISWTTQLKVVWKASYMELKKSPKKYFFHVDGQLLQVCKTFFLDTLSVSDQTVRTTLQKLTGDGHLLPDQRRQPASHKLQDATRLAVRSHIQKFQTVPSHYCRHTSSKQYLPETLTLTEMYRLYVADWM